MRSQCLLSPIVRSSDFYLMFPQKRCGDRCWSTDDAGLTRRDLRRRENSGRLTADQRRAAREKLVDVFGSEFGLRTRYVVGTIIT